MQYLQITQQSLTSESTQSVTGGSVLSDDDLAKDADMMSCLECVVLAAASPRNVPGLNKR